MHKHAKYVIARKICDIMIKARMCSRLAGFYKSHFLEQRLVFLLTKTLPPYTSTLPCSKSGHKEMGKITIFGTLK
jgi:hypothetical protein